MNDLLAEFRTWGPGQWRIHLAEYCESRDRDAVLQLCLTLAGFAASWAAAWWLSQLHWALGLPMSVVTGGFIMRLFVLQHDCGHLAFFRARQLNHIVGRVLSLATMLPYDHWRRVHALHHAHTGKLQDRGIGDIDTLTVEEYRAKSFLQRFAYRFYRHPLVLLLIGPVYYFVIKQRSPFGQPVPWRRALPSVMATNLGLVLLWGGVAGLVGWQDFLLVHAPALLFSTSAGVYLFYVQHQYAQAYWRDNTEWTFTESALFGSSHLKLPRLLHWLTGNIGYHHVHHLCSRIPSYRLPECHRALPVLFKEAPSLTLLQSFAALRLALWDERLERLVPFSALRAC
jgi:acyl-lipid omega-6 desaturase (Delta-12 desaturase)